MNKDWASKLHLEQQRWNVCSRLLGRYLTFCQTLVFPGRPRKGIAETNLKLAVFTSIRTGIALRSEPVSACKSPSVSQVA